MYEKFFGFKERPFQLVPNPAYLFLSKGHEEALAHLTYAVSQGDGFVEITGEVGTGKTTLCRVFLENLGKDIEAAYIFNPMLDAVQLLRAVNDEFGICSDSDNIKDLIDILNKFLMEKKAQGKHIILLIDEAQNLGKDVLEQLRLLSNLETTTSKLLQIILVGQPELRDILDSHELRQLSQRITLSCHLMPLNFKETCEYIQHRIRIASQKPGIKFSGSAFRAIYRYSGGIPRLINIACDRAILTAYGLNQHKISGSIARASIRELASRGDIKKFGLYDAKKAVLIFSALCLIILTVFYTSKAFQNISTVTAEIQEKEKQADTKISDDSAEKQAPAIDEKKELEENKAENLAVKAEGKKPVSENREKKPSGISTLIVVPESETPDAQAAIKENPEKKQAISPDIEALLNNPDIISSRNTALSDVIKLWQKHADIIESLNNVEDTQMFFRLASRQNNLSLYRIAEGLDLIRKLNLPAVLEITPENMHPVYLSLTKIEGDQITLALGEKKIIVKPEDLNQCWQGTAYIPWKNFSGLNGVIPRSTSDDSVIILKMLLQDMGFDNIEINQFYDNDTRAAIEQIQKRHGVKVDGKVGPMTKIIIYNEISSLNIPHISSIEPGVEREAVN